MPFFLFLNSIFTSVCQFLRQDIIHYLPSLCFAPSSYAPLPITESIIVLMIIFILHRHSHFIIITNNYCAHGSTNMCVDIEVKIRCIFEFFFFSGRSHICVVVMFYYSFLRPLPPNVGELRTDWQTISVASWLSIFHFILLLCSSVSSHLEWGLLMTVQKQQKYYEQRLHTKR